MNLEAPRNPNYAATVVSLKDFVELPNCDNVKHALIYGNAVVVGKDVQAGDIGLFFPVETALSPEFLGANNLYRAKIQTEMFKNRDPKASGFFEQHGRVKAVKFRGHKSEGFWIPIRSLDYLNTGEYWPEVGSTFDRIGDHEICRKYVPRGRTGRLSKQQERQIKLEDSIVPGQFHFHYDTENLRRNAHKISPDDYISITDKWHGTSVVISKTLVKRPLKWYDKLLKKLGVEIRDDEYGLIYSSRKVIKSVNGVAKGTANHYYTSDIWGAVASEVQDRIPNGFTLYGEIVGYAPDGSPIQKGYHYGCPVNGHKFLVYRVTSTNLDGVVVELSWPQLKEFCVKYGLEHIKELWYGKAFDFYPYTEHHWNESLVKSMEGSYVNDGPCPYNNNEVPAEGIVVRVDRLSESEAFKLKNFRFLEHETKQLDKGEADIETIESEEGMCENTEGNPV